MSTMTPHFTSLTPLSFLERSAAVFGAKEAVVYGDRSYTYAQFRDEVERQAQALRDLIGPGDRVAFLAPNLPEMLFAHFAVPLAGGVLVAMNTRLSRAEIRHILDHSGSRVLVADSELLSALGDPMTDAGPLERVVEIVDPAAGVGPSGFATDDYDEFVSGGGSVPLLWTVDDENSLIAINYTSGTTGRPRGVMYTHRGAQLNALGFALHNGYSSAARYLWTLPMFHCNGWCTTWAITAVGGTHVCLRAVREDSVWEAIERHGITHLSGAPAVLTTIAGAGRASAVEHPLRIVTGGSPPSPALIAELEALGISVVHGYGLTEVYGPYTICEYRPEWSGLDIDHRARLMARQGVGMVHTGMPRIVDEAMNDVPADGETIGEIVMRGNTVTVGYYRDPEATAAAFAGGWFHSGDLGVMHPDGYIEVKDRAKDLIISGGENVSSIEVENALLAQPEVAEAAVVGEPHPKWGERPLAWVVRRAGEDVDADALRSRLRSLIAPFKVPDRILFIDRLPRTSTGKVLKSDLRAAATQAADERTLT